MTTAGKRSRGARWMLIPFFSGYSVSDRGSVRSTKRGKARILKPDVVNRGDREKSYLRVTLYQNSKGKHRRVHRLVAFAFVPRPKGTDTVDHIDGDTLNNSATNLEWVTRTENTKRAWRNGLMRCSVGARWKR